MAARTSRLMHSGCHVLADACHSTQVQARSLLCGDDFASAGHVMASSACKRKLHDGRAQLAAFSPAIYLLSHLPTAIPAVSACCCQRGLCDTSLRGVPTASSTDCCSFPSVEHDLLLRCLLLPHVKTKRQWE